MKELPFEREFVDLLVGFVNTREREVLSALDDFHRGRLEVKGFGENTLWSTLISIFSLKLLKPKVRAIIGKMVDNAVASVERDLNVNLVDFNPQFSEVMFDESFKYVSDWTEELSNKLQVTMLDGWRAGEGIPELKERIKKVYGDGNITGARAEMIARTETVSIFNGTRIQAAKDSGVNCLKNWDATFDARTGEDSKALHNKYFKHPILLDDLFVDVVNKKEVFKAPNRPNCRCRNDIIPV